MGHLPEAERPWVRRNLRAAWANPNTGEAEAALKALAGQLKRVNPDAAASLREGLAETLTATRLGITGCACGGQPRACSPPRASSAA